MADKEEARRKMLEALPHFRHAVRQAAAEGKVMIGVLSVKDDGSGRVSARFDAPEFFEDLAALLDAPPETEDDRMQASAEELLQKMGLRGPG